MARQMQDVRIDRDAEIAYQRKGPPSRARLARAVASLVLFFAVGLLHSMPVAEIRAEAAGAGWEVSHEANLLISGGSRSSSSREENDVPPEVEKVLQELSQVGSPLAGGVIGLVILAGAIFSVWWRRGAVYGGISAVAWLATVLAFQQNLQSEVDAVDWPGSLDLDFLPSIGFVIAAQVALVGWFVIRWILDRQEDRRADLAASRST